MSKSVTLGVRLNNPGNIEWGSPWQGLVDRAKSMYANTGTKQQQRFCQFIDPAFGIRAIAVTLRTYYDKRKANDGSKIDTIMEVIMRWAPAFENNVRAYANHVGRIMGVDPTEVLDFTDYEVMHGLVVGIIAHENAGYEYPAEVVEEGLRRAGYVKAKQPAVTPTVTAGAAVPAGAAVVTLAPLVEPLAKAVENQQDNLSSGSWIRVAIGAVLIISAAVVAWQHYKRRKAGAV